jgi:hypothetical protein
MARQTEPHEGAIAALKPPDFLTQIRKRGDPMPPAGVRFLFFYRKCQVRRQFPGVSAVAPPPSRCSDGSATVKTIASPIALMVETRRSEWGQISPYTIKPLMGEFASTRTSGKIHF